MQDCSTKKIVPSMADDQSWHFDLVHHQLKNQHGLCLDAEGETIHLWTCGREKPNQRWKVDQTTKHILDETTSRCLSMLDGELVLRACEDPKSHAQTWTVTAGKFGDVRLGQGGCLSMPEPAKRGSAVNVQVCTAPHVAGMWKYEGESQHVRLGSQLCLESPSTYNDTEASVLVSACSGQSARQHWTYYETGQVVSSDTGLCLVPAQPKSGRGSVMLRSCDRDSDDQRWYLDAPKHGKGGGKSTGHPRTSHSDAPLLDLYMYRATSSVQPDYAFGEINTANMDGVIWYLMNEVVTEYTNGVRCPRKFNISMIHRYRVRAKTTSPLFSQGMNFGARWAYDQGQCTGRCFPDNQCTCNSDCQAHFDEFGYVLGCNNFIDKYPFPASNTPAPGGIWYSLPLDGRCEHPTGARDCTWSYEEAGSITLEELEQTSPGEGDCCSGNCTSFWTEQFSVPKTTWRVNQALDVFSLKYPDQPRDLQATCDFKRDAWYHNDTWERRDPWLANCTKWLA